MEGNILELKSLGHSYNGRDNAIKDISFDIKTTGVVGLLGSNGAGKSTTMNIICGVLQQTDGEVFVNGVSMQDNFFEIKKLIGFLPQKAPLYPDLTVDEYLKYTGHLRRMKLQEIKLRMPLVKELCGIEHYSRRLIRNLSGGYQQRVGIAQAIIHDPKLIVFDEPTNGLDPIQIKEIRKLIMEIGKEKAVLYSSHIMQEIAAACTEIKMIEKGTLVFDGSMKNFNQVIESNVLEAKMLKAPSLQELKQIEGILEVRKTDSNTYEFDFEDTATSERIIQLSIEKNWKLQEINIVEPSLDDVFAHFSNSKTHTKK